MRRIPELDGLRGIAILMVVAQHYVVGRLHPLPGTWMDVVLVPGRLAWAGVDLFFVLSGFLVGGILIANREAPHYFRTFYARRAFRILPLYAVVLALFWQPPLVWYATFTQNFWMAARGDHGSIMLAVTWSLAVEEQFYLTLPLLVRRIAPERLGRVLAVCIGVGPLLRLPMLFAWGAKGAFAAAVLLPTHMDGLMLGVLLAWLQHRNVVLPPRVVYGVWIASGALLVLAAAIIGPKPGPLAGMIAGVFIFDVVAFFFASTMLIALRGHLPLLRNRVLTYTGLVSYGLYLLHQPLRLLIEGGQHDITAARDVIMTLAAFAAVFVIAALSWELFEKPLVLRGHRYRYGNLDTAQPPS